MNNLTNEEKRKKEDKESLLGALYAMMFLPVTFCYYGFLIWLIHKKKKYGLDISITDINLHICTYFIISSIIFTSILGFICKLFKNFVNSFLYKFLFFILMILASIAFASAFAILWLFNL